jgi:hypothetical protein
MRGAVRLQSTGAGIPVGAMNTATIGMAVSDVTRQEIEALHT